MVKCSNCKKQIKGKPAWINKKRYCSYCFSKLKQSSIKCSVKSWYDKYLEQKNI